MFLTRVVSQLYISYAHWGGVVHIFGEICQRSDPDISHMGYYLGSLKLKYKQTYSHFKVISCLQYLCDPPWMPYRQGLVYNIALERILLSQTLINFGRNDLHFPHLFSFLPSEDWTDSKNYFWLQSWRWLEFHATYILGCNLSAPKKCQKCHLRPFRSQPFIYGYSFKECSTRVFNYLLVKE